MDPDIKQCEEVVKILKEGGFTGPETYEVAQYVMRTYDYDAYE